MERFRARAGFSLVLCTLAYYSIVCIRRSLCTVAALDQTDAGNMKISRRYGESWQVYCLDKMSDNPISEADKVIDTCK